MVDHVVVQELDVAGPEVHLVAQLVADLGEQIEGLVLRGGEARDRGNLLGRLHERARVLRGELALAHGEDRHRVAGGLAAHLLALPAAVVVGAEQRVQVGPAGQDLVADRRHADDPAGAAPPGPAHAEQAHHVTAVGVPAQRPAGAGLGARGRALPLWHRGLHHLAVEPQLVPHLADQLAVRVLVHRDPEVAAEAPPDGAELLVGVALHRQAAQEHQAATRLQLVVDLGQRGREPREGEILRAHVAPREPAALHRPDGGVDLVDLDRGEGADPVGAPGEVAAVPDHGTVQGLIVEGAHGTQG